MSLTEKACQSQQAANTKTPRMILQEYSVKKKIPPPEYNLIHCKTGTHENEFHFKVIVADIEAIGMGRSKQVAKHDAASKALTILRKMGHIDPDNTPLKDFNPHLHRNEPDSPNQPVVNCIGTLNDLCCENKIPPPYFTEVSDVGPPHCRQFTYTCQLASLNTMATANTKKQTKQLAAKNMLERVMDILPQLTSESDSARNAITQTEEKVKQKYAELSFFNVIPNKGAKVLDFPYCFVNIMEERNLDINTFIPLLKLRTEDALKKILDILELEYQFIPLQEGPLAIVALDISTDTPFCNIGKGPTIDHAKNSALMETFTSLEIYMTAKKC